MEGIDAPVTKENLKFFYAWRTAEGGDAKNNPLNTKQGMKDDGKISNYNEEGVKNYSTREFGIRATIKTLLNGRYPCIIDGLKNDVGAEKISKCFDNLSTWGTGELVNQVIKTDSIRNIPIESDVINKWISLEFIKINKMNLQQKYFDLTFLKKSNLNTSFNQFALYLHIGLTTFLGDCSQI